MNLTLKLEYLGLLILGIFAFSNLGFAWWWFLIFFFAPDISMIGYLFGNKIGAVCYNIFHHIGLGIGIYLVGHYLDHKIIMFIGCLLVSHAAFDRLLGYGLKYSTGFSDTHLGKIGKNKE